MWCKVRETLPNWLALHRVYGVGPIKFQQCLLADPELQRLPGWVKPDWRAVEKDLQWQQQPDCHILTLQDADYPMRLKETANPPPVLFVQGLLNVLNKSQIAMVGSRHPSHHGLDIAYNFAKHFAEVGFVITSGLALGIDTASHKGALGSTDGQTIAVAACGLDQIYPPSNQDLAAKILARGALVSEFPIGVPPVAGNFPSRNRIISGLSLGVLVVEAAAKSGALITANMAAEQGREVFAIPSSIYSAKSKGCHLLIKQGAKLAESAEDIIEELNPLLKAITKSSKSCVVTPNKCNIINDEPLAKEHLALLSYIDGITTSVDDLVMRSKCKVQEVSSILMQLELAGYILAVPGGYVRS